MNGDPIDGVTRREVLKRAGGVVLLTSAAAGGSVQTPEPPTISPYDFGASGDGRADDTQALRAALRAAVATGNTLDLRSGIYRVTGSCVAEGDLHLINTGRAVIHAAPGHYADIGVLVVRGSASRVGGLAHPAPAGGKRLIVDHRAAFVAGDLGTVFDPTDGSFSRFRRYYRAGEFFQVAGVDDETVELVRPLYAGYRAGTVDLYRIRPAAGSLRDVIITSEGAPASLIYIDYARGLTITNPRLRQANNDCILVNRSVECRIEAPDAINTGNGGDDYGIVWSNCQDCSIHGGTIYGRRHAIAHGGNDQANSVPCRNMQIGGNATLRNDPRSNTHCADFHGNCEDCMIADCAITGGVGMGGKNNRVVRSVVHSMANGVAVLAFEVIGGRYEMLGNTFHIDSDPQAATRGAIDFGGNAVAISADTTENLTVVVRDCEFDSAVLSDDSRLLNVRNRGATIKLNVDFSNNRLQLNRLGMVVYMDLVRGTGAAAASDFITVTGNTGAAPGSTLYYADGDYSRLRGVRAL